MNTDGYVSRQIEALQAELKDFKEGYQHKMMTARVAELDKENGMLGCDMAFVKSENEELKHTIERLVSEAANTPELLAELKDCKDALDSARSDLAKAETVNAELLEVRLYDLAAENEDSTNKLVIFRKEDLWESICTSRIRMQ